MKLTKIISVAALLIMILSAGIAYADTVNYNEGPFTNYELVKGIYKQNDYYFLNHVTDVDCYRNGSWQSGYVSTRLHKATAQYGSIQDELSGRHAYQWDNNDCEFPASNDPDYKGWTRIKLFPYVNPVYGPYQTKVIGVETSY